MVSLEPIRGRADPAPSPPPAPPDSKEEVFDQGLIDYAMSFIGLTKQVGYDSPKVKEMVESTDQESDEYYNDGWCNAFTSYVLMKKGYEFPSLNSMDQLGYAFHQVSTPKIGDIVILQGHICFYVGKANFPGFDQAILILGGNQGHSVNVLPIKESYVMEYMEPIKSDPNWRPSRHLKSSSMYSFNRLDDKGYINEILDKELQGN